MKLKLLANSPGKTKYTYFNNDARLRKHLRRMFGDDEYNALVELLETGVDGSSIEVPNREGKDIEATIIE